MNLILGYGLDNIYFGMSSEEVIKLFGLPDKQYESDFDIHFQYFFLQCDLWFRKDDNRLHWIQCSHPEIKIFNQLVIDRDKDELILFLTSKINSEIEYDDFKYSEHYTFTVDYE